MNQSGNLIVSSKSALIYFDLETQRATLVAGNAKQFGFRDGHCSHALFDHPDGVTFLDDSGNILLLADTYNHRIRVIDLQNEKVSTLSGNGDPGHLDGPCVSAKFNFP